MAKIVPLVDIPMNAFFKSGHDHNSSMLYALRKRTKRSDGYFMYRCENVIADTFPLTGLRYTGSWRLGRISTTPSKETDYKIEVYRRSLYLTGTMGTVYEKSPMDDNDLAETLRKLDKGENITQWPSTWDVSESNTFAECGFDIV